MQDEVLSHRLGLIPLKIDPRKLEFPKSKQPHESDTIVFDLRVRCDRIPNSSGETDPKRMYYDSNVYSGMLKWEPSGSQMSKFPDHPRPVQDDVLLVKLRPGQMVDIHCFAKKGVGADHAKFSPVGEFSG